MDIVITIIAILLLTFLLNIVIIQSNNFVFMVFKKPVVWIVFMGVLSFIYFFVGSQFENSFNIIWWSALLAFVLQIPPKLGKDLKISKQEASTLIEEGYNEMGINNGRLKYRIGLGCYLLGGIIGWILFYSKMVIV